MRFPLNLAQKLKLIIFLINVKIFVIIQMQNNPKKLYGQQMGHLHFKVFQKELKYSGHVSNKNEIIVTKLHHKSNIY